VRRALLNALASCADRALRTKTRRFLVGLSRDELQFLAEFLGAAILEYECQRPGSRAELAERVAEFERARRTCETAPEADRDHKMILLLEFLCLSGLEHFPLRQMGQVSGLPGLRF
jgi:hypothetical protein